MQHNPQRAFLRELRLATQLSGLTQRQLARRAGLDPARLSRILAGRSRLDLDLASRLVAGCGAHLSIRIVPGDGVRLRDTGQLQLARVILGEAHASRRGRLEVLVGPPPDRRAADLVLDSGSPWRWPSSTRRATARRSASMRP